MAERNADVSPDDRIEFRMGINLGDIIKDRRDIYGDGVNIAARLEALAESGGICVSRIVRDQVRDKLAFSFEDMGEQQVKNTPGQYAYTASCSANGLLPPNQRHKRRRDRYSCCQTRQWRDREGDFPVRVIIEFISAAAEL